MLKVETYNPLTRKLGQFTRLSAAERSELDGLMERHKRSYRTRMDVVTEGEPPRAVYIMLSGWACRYKQLVDGRRQIVGFFLPGDCCDLHNHVFSAMDHSIGTLTPSTIAGVASTSLMTAMAGSPRIQQAMWWESLVNLAIQREWTVNIGQRSAFERVGHLLCELFLRLHAVGLTAGNTCEMPLTQAELADATGLSAVHANRTLQELRGAGLIVLKDRQLTVPNLQALQEAAAFNPNYLHLDHEGCALDANGE